MARDFEEALLDGDLLVEELDKARRAENGDMFISGFCLPCPPPSCNILQASRRLIPTPDPSACRRSPQGTASLHIVTHAKIRNKALVSGHVILSDGWQLPPSMFLTVSMTPTLRPSTADDCAPLSCASEVSVLMLLVQAIGKIMDDVYEQFVSSVPAAGADFASSLNLAKQYRLPHRELGPKGEAMVSALGGRSALPKLLAAMQAALTHDALVRKVCGGDAVFWPMSKCPVSRCTRMHAAEVRRCRSCAPDTTHHRFLLMWRTHALVPKVHACQKPAAPIPDICGLSGCHLRVHTPQGAPGDALWLQRVTDQKRWAALVTMTVENFLRNDLAWALQTFMKQAKGTFGMAATCELDRRILVLAARQQPISLSIYPEER